MSNRKIFVESCERFCSYKKKHQNLLRIKTYFWGQKVTDCLDLTNKGKSWVEPRYRLGQRFSLILTYRSLLFQYLPCPLMFGNANMKFSVSVKNTGNPMFPCIVMVTIPTQASNHESYLWFCSHIQGHAIVDRNPRKTLCNISLNQ